MWGSRGRRGVAAAALLLAVAPAVAGCGAAGARHSAAVDAAGPGEAAVAPRQRAGGQEGSTARTPGGGARTGTPLKAARSQIVRTATLTVQTTDVAGALTRARSAVENAGGYPADETTDRDPDGRDRSKVVLRVPPEHYDALLARLSGLGKVLSREVSATDVTDQVVDVDSRVKSQRASVERIRALMDRATSISDITALESELGTREADLESLESQLASLKDRTGTATVTLLLRQPGATPDPKPDDGTSFGDALADAWHAFTAAVRWVLVALAAALPFAAAAAALYALWRAIRGRAAIRPAGRRRLKGTAADTGPVEPAGTEPADGAPADKEATGAERTEADPTGTDRTTADPTATDSGAKDSAATESGVPEPGTTDPSAVEPPAAADAPKAPGVSGEGGRAPR
ncbi:DUF4349 domain-containing protein [Streptomyces sp. NPDC059101]|uniref:DUF4349 domain-containing protein n=1 Tax=Streptomyces sp. NPDC059101 TaxID=3346728 RepID=UPI0036C60494